MTTDLTKYSVEELRSYVIFGEVTESVAAFDEMKRRLAAAQEKIIIQQATLKEFALSWTHGRNLRDLVEAVNADKLPTLAAHDAETAAKALEEVEEKFGLLGLNFIFNRAFVKEYLLSRAAEYRAKAKGDKP